MGRRGGPALGGSGARIGRRDQAGGRDTRRASPARASVGLSCTGEERWAVETSKDGSAGASSGRSGSSRTNWFLHAVQRFVRFRPIDEADWRKPLERAGDHPMTLLRMEDGAREELWPGDEHLALPMLLPGGEEGRLLRFEHQDDPVRWTYSLELRGMRE
ncbi:MAG: hypothetical protein ACRDHK_13580 [Actinomycetota bacterium]